jgi:hypothetical protein
VREVFVGKDELFRRVQKRFKALLRLRDKRIKHRKNKVDARTREWERAEQEIANIMQKA